MVYEKVRLLGGAKRHVFLLDSRLLITKDKDADGLYVFKDSLKVSTTWFHLFLSLTLSIGPQYDSHREAR